MLEKLLAMVLAISTGSSMMLLFIVRVVMGLYDLLLSRQRIVDQTCFRGVKRFTVDTKLRQEFRLLDLICLLALALTSLYEMKLELVGCLLNILYLLLRSRSACRQSGVHHGTARFV